MENIRASHVLDITCIDGSKTTASFVRDAPKISRYSLADSADGSNSDMDYHIEIINKNDKLRVLKFLRRFFFRDEPLNHSIQLIPEGEDSTCEELEDYCSHASFENNLSLMAVSADGGIIGVMLNGKKVPLLSALIPKTTYCFCNLPFGSKPKTGKMEPSLDDDEPEYIRLCKNEKFQKILKLLHYIDKNVNVVRQFRDLSVLEIRIISVDTNWRGRGVAKTLIEKTIEIARDQGFHYVRADCTSLFSGKLCARCGFDAIYKLNFTDYVDENGQPIFSPALPHTAATSYIKKL